MSAGDAGSPRWRGAVRDALGAQGPRRYRNLTFGLMAVLVMPPFLRDSFPGAGMLGPLLFVVLVARAMVSARTTRLARAVLITAMVAVALRGARVGEHLPAHSFGLDMALHLLTALGFAFVVYEVLRHVLAAEPVTADKLYAAVSAYLLIGLLFASIYEALEFWQPHAFSLPHAGRDADGLMYFSLVTLSTVGYGDIVPVLPPARVLAVLEAILGQLYLAVLMARLVGLHLSQPGPQAESLPEPTRPTADNSFR
ncbi:MAG TPA: potassium channel family protein [Polyangiales bacterium]